MSWKKTAQSIILSFLVVFALPAFASATCLPSAQSCSSTYSIGEAYFGSGGNLSSCGTTYCSKQSAGETAAGNITGTTYKAQAGISAAEPYIQMIVNAPSTADLGYLHSGTSYTPTATFSVKSYLTSGYVVQTYSPGPATPGHTLSALSTPSASNASAEQFGINLVANSSCAGVSNGNGGTITGSAGAVQVPSGTFSFGSVAHNSASDYYDTACQFMYANGDTIAKSTQSSGETDYTISYLFNIAANTPSGLYTLNQTLVATSTY